MESEENKNKNLIQSKISAIKKIINVKEFKEFNSELVIYNFKFKLKNINFYCEFCVNFLIE